MSSFLIALAAGGGNVPPTMSVTRALLDRGHDVRVLADPVLEPDVRAAGARFVPWTTAPHRLDHDPESDLARDWEARTPMGSMARSIEGYMCGPAMAYADDVRAELEREPADAAAGEMLTFGTMIGARGAGVPCAILSATWLSLRHWGEPPFGLGLPPASGAIGRVRERAAWAISERLWDRGRPAVNAARAAHGLAPVRHIEAQMADVDRVIVLSTMALAYPGFAPPPHVHVTGARLEDPAWATEPVALPAGEAPLVLVGLTTTFQDHASATQRIADALGTLPVRGLITTGPALDPASVAAPPNVAVVPAAPHAELLPRAAAMITHAGHGTLVKALAAGVPFVAMPFGRDQNELAARAARIGAAVTVRSGARPPRIAAAVRRVLEEPAHREAAGRAARTIASELREDRAADVLEELAAEGRPEPARPGPIARRPSTATG